MNKYNFSFDVDSVPHINLSRSQNGVVVAKQSTFLVPSLGVDMLPTPVPGDQEGVKANV